MRIAAAEADARAMLAEAATAEQRLADVRRAARGAAAELGGSRAQGRVLAGQITRLADQVGQPAADPCQDVHPLSAQSLLSYGQTMSAWLRQYRMKPPQGN